MCFPSGLCRVLGSFHQSEGSSHLDTEGGSSAAGSYSQESAGVQILPGSGPLLWKVLAKLVNPSLYPLNELLKSGPQWKWTPPCEQAFMEAKQRLTEAPVLAHYDPSLPLRLAGDAFSYGLGAVISHTYPDESERPIAFASQTLTPSERNYSQLERDMYLT